MKTKVIRFALEFTTTPGGRKRDEGPLSGEEFREDVLIPALKAYDRVELNLDGALGYPSSFIDEAFGYLVEKLSYETVLSKLEIVLTDDELTLLEIHQVMKAHA